jgi:CubicO group peptidase (beta-lactamase class C family)
MKGNQSMRSKLTNVALGLVLIVSTASTFAADSDPPASPEVTAAMQPYLVHRFPEAGGGLFSTTHDIFRYGLMLANDGELDGRRYLSHAAMDELRKEQTG